MVSDNSNTNGESGSSVSSREEYEKKVKLVLVSLSKLNTILVGASGILFVHLILSTNYLTTNY